MVSLFLMDGTVAGAWAMAGGRQEVELRMQPVTPRAEFHKSVHRTTPDLSLRFLSPAAHPPSANLPTASNEDCNGERERFIPDSRPQVRRRYSPFFVLRLMCVHRAFTVFTIMNAPPAMPPSTALHHPAISPDLVSRPSAPACIPHILPSRAQPASRSLHTPSCALPPAICLAV